MSCSEGELSTSSSSHVSQYSWPPVFKNKFELEEYYGEIPPDGLRAKVYYSDSDVDIFYSTSASSSSDGMPVQSSEDDSAKINPNDLDEGEKIFVRKKVYIQHEKNENEEEEEEEIKEEEKEEGPKDLDGNLCCVVRGDGEEFNFDRIKSKERKKRRRIVKARAKIDVREWSYTPKAFTQDPNEYVKRAEEKIKEQLTRQILEAECASNVETTIKNSLNVKISPF